MSNLAKTQAQWTKLFRRCGIFAAQMKTLRDAERKFDARRGRIQVVEYNDTASSTSAWVLAGVVIGTNTDENGKLFVRITDESPGAGQATVDVYKATGGGAGNKVATGSAANGATATLAAANSSGVTGTVLLGTVGASESDDAHHLRVYPDFPLRINALWDGTEVTDLAVKNEALDGCALVQSSLVQAIDQVTRAWTRFLQLEWAEFLGSGQTIPIRRATEDDGTGAISAIYTGLLEDARKDMVDELTAGAQSVAGSTVTSGAGSFDSQNQGVGTVAAPAMKQWAEAGTITAVCVDGTVGAELFELTQLVTATGRSKRALNRLRVEKSFSDPVLGISDATLVRTLSLSGGTGGTNDFGSASNWTITNPTPTNTDDGVLYLKVVAGTVDVTKWKVQVYTSPAYTSTSLVAESDEAAAGGTPGLNAKRSSRLTGVAKIGAAPTAGFTRTLNLQTFRSDNTNGVPDKFTLAVTATARGEFQDRLSEAFGYALNYVTNGSQTINEGFASAGTFPPYEVRDA